MTDVRVSTVAVRASRLNVADRLAEVAVEMPDAVAVVCPRRASPGFRVERRGASGSRYATITFGELDADATQLARGLADWGVTPGTRLALLVRPGIEFVTLVFALLRAGAIVVLVDPGLGRRNLVRCLAEVEPEGFIAIEVAQAIRVALRHTFPLAKWNVTVGRRWFWRGLTLAGLRERGSKAAGATLPETHADDPAAIIFTSGSTGPPKGVLYTQRMFATQVTEIQSAYGIEPGGVDLACFPLFALFNSALGVTTVFPDMDFARPASADPVRLLAAANDWRVSQAFASPTVWRNVGAYGRQIESLRDVFSCGAPVGADVLKATLAIAAPNARMHTPYGATECLPVSTIEAREVLGETAACTDQGEGVCVGWPFESIEWRVIRISDEPIATIDETEELPAGEIGELIVRGQQVSPCYVTRPESNAAAKIVDHSSSWHRMGDVGYFDEQGHFWYCGRKSQRVETASGPLFTECVEAVFNTHPDVARTALVGIGRRGRQTPVLVVECRPGSRLDHRADELLLHAEQHAPANSIRHVLFHGRLPVDVRHNAKIHREQLAAWAAAQLPELA